MGSRTSTCPSSRTTRSRGANSTVQGRVLQCLQPRAVRRAGNASRRQQLWRRQRTGQQPTSGSTVGEADLLNAGPAQGRSIGNSPAQPAAYLKVAVGFLPSYLTVIS